MNDPLTVEISTEEGRPRLWIDDKPVFEQFFVTTPIRDTLDVVPDVNHSGFQIIVIPVNFAESYRKEMEHVPILWTGEREYDWSFLDLRFKQLEEKGPDLKVVLYLDHHPPKWWIKANPDELIVYEEQDRIDFDAPQHQHKGGLLFPSYASEKYREDISHALQSLIQYIYTQPYRDRFVGIHITGGHDGQWMWYGPGQGRLHSDYSEVMRRYFIDLLRKKYDNDVTSLQNAWNRGNVTFETAQIPSAARRNGGRVFEFRSPIKDQDVIDYTEAYAQVLVDILQLLAKTIKEESGGRAWVSAYIGSNPLSVDTNTQAYGRIFHRELLESPWFDGFAGPTYGGRPVDGGQAPVAVNGSFRIHGKLAIDEQDIRTYLARIAHDRANFLYGYTPNWKLQQSILKRSFGHALAEGIGMWYYDMHHGWYSAPEFWNLFSKFQQIGKDLNGYPFISTADIAVIVDDRCQLYLPRNDHMLNYSAVETQRTAALAWLGSPYDLYFLDDLVHEEIKDYKLYLFLGTYEIDSAEREKLHERFSRNGATAVWVYAPGIVSDGVVSTENIEQLTGFRIQEVRARDAEVTLTNMEHPLLENLSMRTYGNPPRMDVPEGGVLPPSFKDNLPPPFRGGRFYSPMPDKEVTILGELTDGGAPGLAVREMDGWTSVYSAGLVFTPELLRSLFKSSGAFLYTEEEGTSIRANSRVLSVYAVTEGNRTLRLPEKGVLRNLYTGERVFSDEEGGFQIFFKQYEHGLYAVEPVE